MSALLSEFCTVKVLVGLENLSALQRSAFRRALMYCRCIGVSIGTAGKRPYK